MAEIANIGLDFVLHTAKVREAKRALPRASGAVPFAVTITHATAPTPEAYPNKLLESTIDPEVLESTAPEAPAEEAEAPKPAKRTRNSNKTESA